MKPVMRVNIAKMTNNLPNLEAALKALVTQQVLVGVPSDDTYRGSDGVNNATLAFIHDKGSPAQNIPARPFLGPGIEAGKPVIMAQLKKTAVSALEGRHGAVDQGLNAVGLVAQAAIRRKLVDGPFAALKRATLAARRRKGFTGESPLNVTGQLRNSINYVIRKK